MFKKAEENLPPELMNEIEEQLEETRLNLVAYEYQRMMMLQKMDTLISQEELEKYYSENETSFMLTSNIVKALFIKLPVETPNIMEDKIAGQVRQSRRIFRSLRAYVTSLQRNLMILMKSGSQWTGFQLS